MIDKDILKQKVNATLLKGVTKRSGGSNDAMVQHVVASNLLFDNKKKEDIVDYLRSDQRVVDRFDNKMIRVGNTYSGVSISGFAHWILKTAFQIGTKFAIETALNYLEVNYNHGYSITALSGVKITKRYSLTPSITLLPFAELQPSPAKFMLAPNAFAEQNLIANNLLMDRPIGHRPPEAAIVYSTDFKPPTTPLGLDRTPLLHYTRPSEIAYIVSLFAIVLNCVPVSTCEWEELAPTVPCNTIGNSYGGSMINYLGKKNRTVTDEHICTLSNYLNLFIKLDKKVQSALQLALRRLIIARGRDSSYETEDKVIDYGIACETLFLSDNPENKSSTLKQRVKSLNFADVPNRFKKCFAYHIYDLRSQAVHTGRIKENVEIDQMGIKNIHDMLQKTDDLLVFAAKQVLNTGKLFYS